jgi:hypothetical protein
VSFEDGQSRNRVGTALLLWPTMLLVETTTVEVGIGVVEDDGLVEVDCAPDSVVREELLLLLLLPFVLLLDSLDDRDASAPPTPPPTAAATTTSATPSSSQNVFFHRPHIVRGAACSYSALSYTILLVSVPALGTVPGELLSVGA